MKGISSIIATLLVLIITIGLFGFSYTYISGVFTTKTAEVFYVVDAFSDTVTISNDGTAPITAFRSVKIDGSDAVYRMSKQDNSSVGYWKMDELDRITATDSSGKGNTGTFNGETFNDGTINGAGFASGQYGNALQFDGVDDYVNVSSITDLPIGASSRTIEAWIMPNKLNPGGTVFALNNVAAAAQSFIFQFATVGGNIYVFTDGINGANNIIISGSQLPTNGSWNHVAFTLSGSAWNYYLNGVSAASGTFSVAINTIATTATIGKRDDGGNAGSYFNGTIDEVRIYNRALSQSEIQEDMNYTYPVSRSVAWYNFNNDANDRHNIVKGKYGAAKAFDGVNDIVSVTDHSSIQNIFVGGGTVEFWASATAPPANNMDILGKDDGVGWRIYFSSAFAGTARDLALVKLFTTGTGQWITVNQPVEVGTPAFYTVVYNQDSVGNDPILYKNGVVLPLDEVLTPTGVGQSDVGVPLAMGSVTAGFNKFNGQLDEVRIYNRALTAQEIKANYDTGSQINPGEIATMKIYNQLSKGTHTLKMCTTSTCNTAVLRIN
ncbi:MAG: LamG domain-containing protein [Candidatus Aenigmarchaeota archaeon]|nr:LamG domain-containing protein [Candidatus Aenigmarchaeota archaeon]